MNTIELFLMLFAYGVLDLIVGVAIGQRIAARRIERKAESAAFARTRMDAIKSGVN